ncbi:hypothetical protein [Hyphomicrobium sp. LHD-15]|uniref:hypothetical protein n=1 Tax=Hyphomicrobium sp. LHD-15 TaxID=3072142 RepID=UPI00280F8E92|nr:hypothetical protein [Hyphomicrobium sp. LHD-15]MDQ8700306.1 hypothetical protein [Hyphomicrobium sp. LHD-15]
MTGNWNIILVISLGAAVASVLVLNLKSRFYDESDSNPPTLRHVAAYFLAYVLGFLAVETFDRPWSLLAVAAVAAIAFAVTLNGRKPLMTRDYARTAALTFAVFFALWGLHQALLLIGIDLLAKDFVARS